MADRQDEMNRAFGVIESIYGSLKTENAQLQSELRALHKQLEQNRRQQVQTVEALRAENESLMKHNDMLQSEVSRLRRVESDRIVRSALDQSSDGRDAHESSSMHREWASSGTTQPLGSGANPATSSSDTYPASSAHTTYYTSNTSSMGRPPRVPAPSDSSSDRAGGGLLDLDTSGVAPAGGAALDGFGADSLNDSMASSRSLLRALQGGAAPPRSAAAGDDGELALLMSALSAAAAPSSGSTAGTAPSMAASTTSTASGTPGRAAPGDHVLNSTRGSVAEQLQRVAAAQSRLSASTKPAAASAAQQVRPPHAREGTAARLGDEWWAQLSHAVPADRVDLLQSYLRQHDGGKLSASSLATRARVLLVDSVNSAARTGSGGAVASKAVREALVQRLANNVGGS